MTVNDVDDLEKRIEERVQQGLALVKRVEDARCMYSALDFKESKDAYKRALTENHLAIAGATSRLTIKTNKEIVLKYLEFNDPPVSVYRPGPWEAGLELFLARAEEIRVEDNKLYRKKQEEAQARALARALARAEAEMRDKKRRYAL